MVITIPGIYFPKLFFKVPHLVFSLYPDKLLEHYHSNKPVLYQVKFKSLSTKWRYIFTDPSFKKFASLGIKDIKKDSYPFIKKDLLLNGLGMVKLFESKESIKLNDSYSGDFQLIENPDSEPKKRNIILKTLPSASPDVIYHGDSSSNDIYSHIFI